MTRWAALLKDIDIKQGSGIMSPTSGGYLVLVVLAVFFVGCAAPEERKCWGTPEAGLIVGYEDGKPCYCEWAVKKRICIE